jgi:dipeptidyl aminopeptidase/acylaminoacyl peptidase
MGAIGRTVLGPVRDGRALIVTGSATAPSGLRELDIATGAVTDVRLAVDEVPAAGYLPEAQLMSFAGDKRTVHAVVYPPRNQDFAAPDGELPPYIAFVHGGPTAHVAPALSLTHAFFTSRGIGVVDVNYGGSTGYGREYRDRLRGQWGVIDVEDTVAAVRGLGAAGLADPDRLAIEGGSAGGWTVLAALTGTSAFACGVSYFGVAELVRFAQETHDFESRYLDGLIGPLPEARELYDTRAPLNNVAGLSCPVLLLQGLDDPIVPPAQAELFRDALVRKGLPHAYRTYAGESHGFRKVETIVDSRQAELSFYGQIFGFTPPGVPAIELWRP